MGLTFLGTGCALPARATCSDALDAAAGRPEGWLAGACGVTRRFVAQEETQVSLGTEAAQAALAQAGLNTGQIDLVIAASAVPYQAIPTTAPLYIRALGIGDGAAAGFDINATCLSFVTALEVAEFYLSAGRCRRALIISSEIASRGLPWEAAPDVAGLFSDGAGAAVVEAAPGKAFIGHFRTYPSAWEACQLRGGGTRYRPEEVASAADYKAVSTFEMDGKALFKVTAANFPGFLDQLLARAGWEAGDVALVVPHQASPGALKHLVKHSGLKPDQVYDIASDYGNQIAASIPVALSLARAEGRVRPGDRLLILGTSAGVSFGGIAMEV